MFRKPLRTLAVALVMLIVPELIGIDIAIEITITPHVGVMRLFL